MKACWNWTDPHLGLMFHVKHEARPMPGFMVSWRIADCDIANR